MKLLIILCQILGLFCSVQCQIENGWKGIKVFETTRAEVEGILGKPKEESTEARYEDTDGVVLIEYSGAPCSDRCARGEYNIPQDTVFRYRLRLSNKTMLSDFSWEKNKYVRIEDPGVSSFVYYYDSNEGIRITTGKSTSVNGDLTDEEVLSIEFERTREQELKFSCKK